MMHVEGSWSFKYSGLKNICGIPVGAYFTLSGTVSDMAWIAAAGVAFVAFAATIVATNDRACKKRFSKKYI